MNTPSHFILAAAARKAMPKLRMPASAILIGSVAPDIPLYVLCLGALIYFPLGLDCARRGRTATVSQRGPLFFLSGVFLNRALLSRRSRDRADRAG